MNSRASVYGRILQMLCGYPSMQELVDKANTICLDFEPVDGFSPMDFVRMLVDPNDLVFGVWQETETRPGVVIVKGAPTIASIALCGVAEELLWTAIPLRSPEEGAALQEALGLPRILIRP